MWPVKVAWYIFCSNSQQYIFYAFFALLNFCSINISKLNAVSGWSITKFSIWTTFKTLSWFILMTGFVGHMQTTLAIILLKISSTLTGSRGGLACDPLLALPSFPVRPCVSSILLPKTPTAKSWPILTWECDWGTIGWGI